MSRRNSLRLTDAELVVAIERIREAQQRAVARAAKLTLHAGMRLQATTGIRS